MSRVLFLVFLLATAVHSVSAQEEYSERVNSYIKQYADYAIADQRKTGVPAAITLSQGILETDAGNSELVLEANNHFGIKCKNNWTGPTFLHTDDARNECFKKYGSALESYCDHSNHLHINPRYRALFTYQLTDYKKWCHGLKKCGYATNPKYAYQLIKIIETYELEKYTEAALDSNYVVNLEDKADSTEDVFAEVEVDTLNGMEAIAKAADSARAAILWNEMYGADYPSGIPEETAEPVIENINGLKAVAAKKEEMLLKYAMKYKIRYAHLLEINDMQDGPIPFDTYIYLEKKHATGIRKEHVVKEGESLLQIAQNEGIQLKRLAAFNHMSPNDMPVVGQVLQMQSMAPIEPIVSKSGIKVYSSIETEDEVLADTSSATRETNGTAGSEREVGFGMGFQAPPAETKYEYNPEAQPTEIKKLPFMEGDPPQPQLRKPKTEQVFTEEDKLYRVKHGDTAYSIAKRNGVTVADLMKWNNLEPQDLKAGQVIKVRE